MEQIAKDVPRTNFIFSENEVEEDPLSEIPIDKGLNPIYNILSAYAELDPGIGYTQGMNFLAALLYLATGDETVAFVLLTKVMLDLNWRACYQDQLIKLISLTKKLKLWMMKDEKALALHLDAHGVLLEAQIASPLMAIFANLLPLETSL